MTNRCVRAIFATFVAALPISSAIAQDITVRAPRQRSSATGAPIEIVTTSRVVSTSDLDLRTKPA